MNQHLPPTRVIEHKTALDFSNECVAWLSQNEVINHNVISLAHTLQHDPPIYSAPFLFNHVVIDGAIAGCCIYAEPDGLVLSEFEVNTVPILFAHLAPKIGTPSRIFGPREAATSLAELFANFLNTPYEIHSTWRTHVLEQSLTDHQTVDGHVRKGDAKDRKLVSEWGKQYDRERPANVDIECFLLNKLADGNLRLWVDSEPTCLATVSGLNCTGPRISAVYTPESNRGHGYASALVFELSRDFLQSGSAYVTLGTQVGDPAERIYQRIGYRPVGERTCIVFA